MKKNSAGALLFALITAFVLSMVGGTLVLLTSNQYRIINSEIERITAFYLAQAGMEYAIYKGYTDPTWFDGDPSYSIDIDGIAGNDVTITITDISGQPNPISNYKIKITTI